MQTNAHTRIHLVTTPAQQPKNSKLKNPAPAAPQPEGKKEPLIAVGLLRYKTLKEEFDEQVLSATPDLDRLPQLQKEMELLLAVLRDYGFQGKP